MRKVISMLLLLVFTFSLTGMTVPIKVSKQSVTLKDGETFIELKSNGEAVMSFFYTISNFNKTLFKINKNDTDKAIIKKLEGDSLEISGRVSNFKRTKKSIEFKILYQKNKADTLYPHITLKEYAENILGHFNSNLDTSSDNNSTKGTDVQSFYKIFVDREKPIYYKDGKNIKASEISKYADNNLLTVSGFSRNAYYEVPSEILLVSGNLKYKKITNNTIYVQGSKDGYIIVKKYSISKN